MSYVRAIAGLLATAAVLWLISTVNHWRKDAAALPGARAETARVQASFNEFRRNTAAELARVNSVAQGYENELQALRADRGPPVSLRVQHCPAAARPAAGNTAAAPGPDAPTAGARSVPGVPEGNGPPSGSGIDAGPVLELAARDADTVTAIARGLQEYIRGLPASCMIAPAS